MILTANGHLALELALKAFDLTGEVITTPFTFVSTTQALINHGLKPIFCDIKDDFTIDEALVESLITPRTSAILAVHVYGNLAAISALKEIARRHKLRLIVDGAHAFGCAELNQTGFDYADATMFSFHATKLFHTVEGGGLIIPEPERRARAQSLRNFGLTGQQALAGGTNAKLSEFHAAMGLCNLATIEAQLANRARIAEYYDRHLAGLAGLQSGLFRRDQRHNRAYYPILIDEPFPLSAAQLEVKLKEQAIFTRRYFWPLTSRLLGEAADSTPKALWVSNHVLCLPLFNDMSPGQAETVVRAIRQMGEGDQSCP